MRQGSILEKKGLLTKEEVLEEIKIMRKSKHA